MTPAEARYAVVSFDHFAFLVDDVLRGDEPDDVYDLDTGEKTEIVVTAKVTRSSDSPITLNPLEEDRP